MSGPVSADMETVYSVRPSQCSHGDSVQCQVQSVLTWRQCTVLGPVSADMETVYSVRPSQCSHGDSVQCQAQSVLTWRHSEQSGPSADMET